MRIANLIAFILVIIGAINWGLYGLFELNLLTTVFGDPLAVGSVVVYVLIALSALWLILSAFLSRGCICFCRTDDK